MFSKRVSAWAQLKCGRNADQDLRANNIYDDVTSRYQTYLTLS